MPKTADGTLAKRLTRALVDREMTFEDAARELKTSPQNVRNWANGFCGPGERRRKSVESWLSKEAKS